MIRKLAISNFHSIKNRQEINLVIGKNAPNLPERFATPTPLSDERIPRVVVLFGPNGSGKTTALKAIAFLKWFVESSFDTDVSENPPFMPFLGENAAGSVTELSIELDGQIFNQESRCLYRYELAFNNPINKPSYVTFEKLSYAPEGNFRRIFEREKEDLKFGKEFQIRKNDPRSGTVRPNASLISTFAKFGHPFSLWILEGVSRLYTDIFTTKIPPTEENAIQYYSENPETLDQLNHYIRLMDLGIKQVKIHPTGNKPNALFTHLGLVAPVVLGLESLGTRNFFSFFPYLNYVLRSGGIAILDDFDSSIHPLLLPEIVRWFYDSKINERNAQLIMSCHNATLLEELEKEEVFFTEKNNKGETEIYGLKDIDKVRRDTNIYKKYLGGVFGAVPHIG